MRCSSRGRTRDDGDDDVVQGETDNEKRHEGRKQQSRRLRLLRYGYSYSFCGGCFGGGGGSGSGSGVEGMGATTGSCRGGGGRGRQRQRRRGRQRRESRQTDRQTEGQDGRSERGVEAEEVLREREYMNYRRIYCERKTKSEHSGGFYPRLLSLSSFLFLFLFVVYAFSILSYSLFHTL